MAIARAFPGARLLSLTSTSLRRLNSTARPPSTRTSQTQTRPQPDDSLGPVGLKGTRNKKHQSQNIQRAAPNKRPGPNGAPSNRNAPDKARKPPGRPMMNIPQQARRFIHGKDNLLKTTPDTWAFLQETGIEYDNSKASTLYLGREDAARISNDFTTRVMFTSRHIMHPHDLEYLDPREHPLTETMKAKYRKMIKDEPLWVIMTSANAQPGLIKSIGHRRLKAAFWTAMNELGYERFPEPGAPCISGTLLVTIRDTAKAANSPAQIFGKAVAEALHRERIKQEQPRTRTENRDTRSPR